MHTKIKLLLWLLTLFVFAGCGNDRHPLADKLEEKLNAKINEEYNSIKETLDEPVNEQKPVLDSLLDAWKVKVFRPALNEAGFKQNCLVCGDIYWDVELSIGKNGKVENLKILNVLIDCSDKAESKKKALQNTVLNSIKKLVFPDTFSGKKLTCHFGQATRC